MPDYKALYFELFRASEQAARILLEAQQKAEEQIMEDDSEPLVLKPLRHRLRDATSPNRGGLGSRMKLAGYARGSPTRGAVERKRD